VIDWSPRAFQLAQLLILATVAVFVGSRYLPARYRQKVGVALTVCYVAAAVAIYLLVS
jgi:hypothetical protein